MSDFKYLFLLAFLFIGPLTGCPEDDSAGGSDAAAGGAGGAGGDDNPCGAIDCSGNGTCSLVGGLPDCTCDEGFVEQGLDCVALAPPVEPPAGFSCRAPGGQGALFTTLTEGRWAFVQSDRNCEVSGVKDIYRFRPDGIFTIRSQFGDVAPGGGGTLLYGCWSVIETLNDRLDITYDYANETMRNCGPIAGLADPPACRGFVAYAEAEDALHLITSEERNQERILFFRVPAEPACAWCGEDPMCCARPSWVADASGPLCD